MLLCVLMVLFLPHLSASLGPRLSYHYSFFLTIYYFRSLYYLDAKTFLIVRGFLVYEIEWVFYFILILSCYIHCILQTRVSGGYPVRPLHWVETNPNHPCAFSILNLLFPFILSACKLKLHSQMLLCESWERLFLVFFCIINLTITPGLSLLISF